MIKRKKENKYCHVGRPTNDEVRKFNKKKKLKIIGIVSCVLIVIGSFF